VPFIRLHGYAVRENLSGAGGAVYRGVYCRFYRVDATFALNLSGAVRPSDVMVNETGVAGSYVKKASL